MTMTMGQIESSLQAALTATLPEDEIENSYVYVCDFSDTFVIYCVNYNEYLQDDYATDDSGNITLAGNPVPVKSVTTYVPVEVEAQGIVDIERRAIRGARGVARPEPIDLQVKSEPLTYHRHSRASYFRDLILPDRTPGARERLQRHGQEMDAIAKERQERAWRSMRAGSFEYRVEPNRTDGQGGYFAPPLWLNALFATANRPRRVLAALIPGRFDLPMGVSSINLPIITQGTAVLPVVDTDGVDDQDITDAAGSSTVATLVGDADVALQLLEQSPQGAHLDWALFMDLTEALDAELELQLLNGAGATSSQLLGVINVSGEEAATYTDASPTGSEMYPYFGQAAGQVGDARKVPPEVWLMRTARWTWLSTQETTAGLPFGIPSPFFMGNTPDTPDPIGGLIGWPVFLDDAIPATLGAGGNQDTAIILRPSDLLLLEGEPQTLVDTQTLSSSLGVRLQLHKGVAAITNRRPAGIATVGGTGFIVQSSF